MNYVCFLFLKAIFSTFLFERALCVCMDLWRFIRHTTVIVICNISVCELQYFSFLFLCHLSGKYWSNLHFVIFGKSQNQTYYFCPKYFARLVKFKLFTPEAK